MKTIEIIGFPMDLGADTRGVDMGPSALRIAGLVSRIRSLGYEVIDQGNVEIEISTRLDLPTPSMKYIDEILKVSEVYASKAEEVLERGHFPLFIGGDHSMAIGSLAGIAAHCRKEHKRLGVLWIDAHTDMNTDETSPSGNVHGMPLAASMGIGNERLTKFYGLCPKVHPEHVTLIGIRSIDQEELVTTRKTHVTVYTMSDIDQRGIYPVISEAIASLREEVDHLHVSFDVDSLDPDIAPGVGTPVPGGLNYREAHLLMEEIAESGMLASLEVTEVNPILDERNKTAEIAVQMVESALGKRIF